LRSSSATERLERTRRLERDRLEHEVFAIRIYLWIFSYIIL